METLDELRGLRLVVADGDAPRAASLQQRLMVAGFAGVERVDSLEGLRTRLQEALRYREQDLALVLLSVPLWQSGSLEQTAHIAALAGETHTCMLLTAGEEPAEALLARARAAGFLDVVGAAWDGARLLQQLLLSLSLRQERRLRREREEHLEGQLSERRVMEARLHFIAYHDELTGLFNRRRLRQALDVALLHSQSFGRPCSLLLLDLDRFKLVNDLEGSEVGDRLLIEVSRLLTRLTEPEETVARIGSDEFVLLLERCDEREALRRAEELRRELEAYRFNCNGRQYRALATLGVATVQPHEEGLEASEVLGRVDQACYIAKQNGRNRIHLYSASDPQLVHLRSDYSWAPRIREALEQDRLLFYSQPVVRMSDGSISHYELLIRMRDPDGEIHPPGEFIPVAERTGLIHEIDLWAVDQAIDFLAALPPTQAHICVNVNLSAHAFNNRRLLSLVSRKLELSWVSPTRLVFEITETAAVDNLEQSRELMARLRALGCRFALDDFGAGFSTFQYLKRFPVDYLKLDGSFIVNLLRDPVDQALVRHMVGVARSLGKKIVAEFVEDAETYRMLREFGVDYAQGHFIGRAAAEPQQSWTPPREGRVTNRPLEVPKPTLVRDLADAGEADQLKLKS